ncbi:hypothetical protein [Luteipulveratus halotolerans]|uniref:Uncharacterized protein n=1 Tax=Luteipulveratus halotolerans TaxID=1631356 RepID=A0A0L6CMW7_9MICO|nr:hypothetical protein [Luteipulveratus halotolerans]KNX38893.1 hypothetical protein VV01_19975 [Luteipulveratus halotolerans]
MHKSNRNALLGGVAGVATIAALAFTSAGGSGGGAGLMPAAGGAGTPTVTVAPPLATPSATDAPADGTSEPADEASTTGTSTDSPSDDTPSETSTKPTEPAETTTPSASSSSTAEEPTSNGGRLDPPSPTAGLTVSENGYTLHAYPGYCTPPQTQEHLRTTSVILSAPEEAATKAWGWRIRIEGAGGGSKTYVPKDIDFQSGALPAAPLQWTGTNDDFSIVVYREGPTHLFEKVLTMNSKDAANFADQVSRWCDGKSSGSDQGGDTSTPPSSKPTGPKIQAG